MLLNWFSVSGQESIHKTYTHADGLPSNTIYDIRQDAKGYVWVATDMGLTRFNGNTFKEYPVVGNKSASISNILFVNGATWVQNFNGQFFKTKADKLLYQSAVSKCSNFNLAHDFSGKTFAALSEKKVLIFQPLTQRVKPVTIPQSVWISSINSSKKEYCLSNFSFGEIIRINETGKVKREKIRIPLKSVYYHWLIGKKEEYFISKVEKKLFEHYSGKVYDFAPLIRQSFVQNACFVSEKQIAILTTNGVILFDTETRQFRRIFSRFSCSKLIRDREGNWWIGTLGDGLIFVPHQEAKIYLEGIEISSLQRSGNHLFIGTKENSIYRYDTRLHSLELMRKDPENHEVKSLFYRPEKNELLYCNALFHYQQGNSARKSKPVSVNQITPLPDKQHYLLCESNNLTIFPVHPNDRWLQWKTGKRALNEDRLTLFDGNRRFLNAVFYRHQIIAHASDGLWIVDQTSARKLQVGNKPSDIIHIFNSPKGIIITTGDQGIFLFSGGKMKKLQRLSNLVRDQRLYKTKYFNNRFYILTYTGTIIANENGNLIQEVMRSDGYPNVDVIDFEVMNRTIYASTTNGFQIIPIPVKKTAGRKPVILLDECFLNGEKIEFTNNRKFQPDENSIHFNLSVINFRALGNHLVYYSVNGKKWIPVEENKLQLNELASGNYRIRMYAQTDRNRNTSEITEINFEIGAPFYKRWWFTALMLIALGLVGFILFKYRINQVKQKNQILQEKLNLEKQLHESSLAAIKSQMNPHFLFNALNTIQSFIYTNEKEAASSYLVDFSELTRKILEMSNQPFVMLSEELEALRLYLKLEKMRFEEDFDFEMDTRELPHEAFQIPSMLIQPYVENAIKHGLLHKKGEKKLRLKFTYHHPVLSVLITDNGIGLEASKKINASRNSKHQSFATDANQKRFELLNQLSQGQIGVEITELKDELGTVLGTSVKLSIPIQQVVS